MSLGEHGGRFHVAVPLPTQVPSLRCPLSSLSTKSLRGPSSQASFLVPVDQEELPPRLRPAEPFQVFSALSRRLPWQAFLVCHLRRQLRKVGARGSGGVESPRWGVGCGGTVWLERGEPEHTRPWDPAGKCRVTLGELLDFPRPRVLISKTEVMPASPGGFG